MTQQELKNGTNFFFNNEEWCERMQDEDFRGGWVTFDTMINGFAIFFNGSCIHTSKTFSSTQKRLEKLMDKWNCNFAQEEVF